MKKNERLLAPMPKRKELSDTPVKLCCEISRLFHARMRENGHTEGVMSQPGAGLVLSFLAINDGLSQKDLVKATHLRPPSVSLIIKKMVEENIVKIENDEQDMRIMRVYLTDHGRLIDSERINDIKRFDLVAHASLSDEETATLMELLMKIRGNLLSSDTDFSKQRKD